MKTPCCSASLPSTGPWVGAHIMFLRVGLSSAGFGRTAFPGIGALHDSGMAAGATRHASVLMVALPTSDGQQIRIRRAITPEPSTRESIGSIEILETKQGRFVATKDAWKWKLIEWLCASDCGSWARTLVTLCLPSKRMPLSAAWDHERRSSRCAA